MRFQQRDGELLLAIQAYDGVLAQRHIWRKFFKGKSKRAMQKRMSKLVTAGYVDRTTVQPHYRDAENLVVYWLNWRGILYVAQQSGVEVEEPDNDNENQMRGLAARLSKQGIRWVRKPPWGWKLQHDLKASDFRIAVEEAVSARESLVLTTWLGESIFRRQPDTISYTLKGADDRLRSGKQGVIPDGYFAILDIERKARGVSSVARFLLELDMATHANGVFGDKKVAPYFAYIDTPAYKERFGQNNGQWLIVTTGQRRLENLMRQAKLVVGDSARQRFFFTTFPRCFREAPDGQLEVNDVLAMPIWQRADSSDAFALMP
jgi:hypothetical protein